MALRSTQPRPVLARLRALLIATHLGPSLAVTAMAALLAVHGAARGAGPPASLPAATVPLVALAVLAGQFSVGWSNDAIDARRDTAAGRRDKPAATGAISVRALWYAAGGALLCSLVLAAALGPAAAVINATMTAIAWAYNLGLKTTPASPLPYLASFGLLPAFAAAALAGHPLPRWPVAVAAGLLGAGAHFVNVLPDLDADRATGVAGLPQRMAARYGPRRGPVVVRATALVLLLAASLLLTLAASPSRRWIAVAGLCAAFSLAVLAARGTGRVPFLAAIAIAGVNVIVLAAGAEALTLGGPADGGRRDGGGWRHRCAEYDDDHDPGRALGVSGLPVPAGRADQDRRQAQRRPRRARHRPAGPARAPARERRRGYQAHCAAAGRVHGR